MDALHDGDGELAELLMRRHIRMSRKHIENVIKQQNESSDNDHG